MVKIPENYLVKIPFVHYLCRVETIRPTDRIV